MTHRIKSIITLDNHILLVTFQNGTIKKYHLETLFSVFPQFIVLKKDEELYRSVNVDIGGYGISWNDELDLDAEEIWENGVEAGYAEKIDIKDSLAAKLIEARNKKGITQKQLADVTGIYQADISKIERGLANPSLSTLKRLADGLDMQLKIEFEES